MSIYGIPQPQCHGWPPNTVPRLLPADGTPPVYPVARHDEEGYDSDDEFVQSASEMSKGFDLKTGAQKMNDFCVQGHQMMIDGKDDRRFMLPSYQPRTSTRFCRKGYAVDNADAIISLSPAEEDTFLVQGATLAKHHSFFAASLSNWVSNELESPIVINGCTIKYRYELDLHKGDSMLIGKRSVTPPGERQSAWNAARSAGKLFIDDFDELLLQKHFDDSALTRDAAFFDHVHLAVHRLGLALILGFPLKLYHSGSQTDGKYRWPLTMTTIMIKLMDWIHQFGSFKAMGNQIVNFMFLPKNKAAMECAITTYPYTYLRVATILESEELFRRALNAAVFDHIQPQWPILAWWTADERDAVAEATGDTKEGLLLSQLGNNKTLADLVEHCRQIAEKAYASLLLDFTRISLPFKIDPTAALAQSIAIRAWHHFLDDEAKLSRLLPDWLDTPDASGILYGYWDRDDHGNVIGYFLNRSHLPFGLTFWDVCKVLGEIISEAEKIKEEERYVKQEHFMTYTRDGKNWSMDNFVGFEWKYPWVKEEDEVTVESRFTMALEAGSVDREDRSTGKRSYEEGVEGEMPQRKRWQREL